MDNPVEKYWKLPFAHSRAYMRSRVRTRVDEGSIRGDRQSPCDQIDPAPYRDRTRRDAGDRFHIALCLF